MLPLPASPPRKPDAESPAFARGRFAIQYHFDKDKESMKLGTLDFSSSTHGMATAVKFKDGSPRKNLVLRTTDGGSTWSEVEIGATPYSLTVLDEANSWIVGDNRLFYSDEGGARWTRRKLPDRKALRVHFQSPERGWAFGIGNIFWETGDGGRSWQPVKESTELKLNSNNTIFAWMEFATPKLGMLVGTSRHREEWDSYLPEWMLPERLARQRMLPGVILTVVTQDGGVTWKPNRASAFGDLVKVRMKAQRGLGLLAYDDGFDWPSEVNGFNLLTSVTTPIFRRPQIHVTDAALVGESGILLVGIEAPGRLKISALNGRVKAFYSPNASDWYDMKVDYRAEGTFARLARLGDNHFWIASDSGMILKLVQ